MFQEWSDIFFLLIIGIYLITLLSIVTVVILENRHPIRSIAWIVTLVFLPIVGLFFYMVFGQNFRQRKKIHKLSIRNQDEIKQQDEPYDVAKIEQFTDSINTSGLIRLLYNNNEAFPYENSQIDIFTNGRKTFQAIFDDIKKAKDHIHIEFYIIVDDEVGNRLRDILIQKAKEGVTVRVIYDYWGSFKLKKEFIQPMVIAGVNLRAFFPPQFPYFLSKINYRNHRKLVVVDGQIAYTGGINMADRYLKGDLLGQWRDTMVRFEGSAVFGLQETFISDWFFVDRNMLTEKRYFPTPKISGKNLVQLVDAGPDTEWMSIMHGIYFAITTAKAYIYIQTPYFMPTEVILTAMETAALRGLDVRLMLPKKSDTSMARSSNASYIQVMLNAGVKVYLYDNGFLHSKTIVIDDMISTVGTSNMDFRSYEQNFEVNAFIYEKETALKLKTIFFNDLAFSTEITEEQWRKRPRIKKINESFSRLFSPMM